MTLAAHLLRNDSEKVALKATQNLGLEEENHISSLSALMEPNHRITSISTTADLLKRE